jgi:PiT family inorganic phosphate transporter
MVVAIFVLTLVLAAVNGGNDVAKGVATLTGAGVTRERTAIAWGVAWTLLGSLLAYFFAARLAALFSRGIVTVAPTLPFALAVLIGTCAWVGLATATRLPVSTTHAIVGALVGAGLLFAPDAVNWSVLASRVALPLLASVLVSYLISSLLGLIPSLMPECVCVDAEAPAPIQLGGPETNTAALCLGANLPVLTMYTGTLAECRAHNFTSRLVSLTVRPAHWFASGATSFARGLNDTPKIVAIGAFGLVPAGLATSVVVVSVAIAMACGGSIGGARLTRVLGKRIVSMRDLEGLRASATTAVLVGIGANLGLPMSTTHVSTGAIAGIAGAGLSRLNHATLRHFVLAWTATPLVAALVAAGAFAALR